MTRNGFYNQPRPTHAFNDTEGELLVWHDVIVDKPPKTSKQSDKSNRAPRRCGNCGECGHDKRSCPKSKGDSASMTVAQLQLMLNNAIEKEQVQEQLGEVLSPASQVAAGTGLQVQ